jgi:hypothetical protein
LINGSPNKAGCTCTALTEAAKTLNEEGIRKNERRLCDMLNQNKKAIFAAILLVAAAALILGFWMQRQPAPSAGEKSLTISVIHGDGSQRQFDLVTTAENLGDALVEAGIAEDNQQEFGLYIITADGETADEAQQQWWRLTSRGVQLTKGASETMIHDGDVYELTLTTGPSGG